MTQLPVGRFYLPATMAPLGSEIVSTVVIGQKGNQLLLEQRLPMGVQWNPDNPAHVLAWFMTVAADQLLPHAMETWRRNEEMRRRMNADNPVIVVAV